MYVGKLDSAELSCSETPTQCHANGECGGGKWGEGGGGKGAGVCLERDRDNKKG